MDISNIRAVARREYVVRARTRTFRLTTVLLVVAALGISLAPVLFRWLDRNVGPTAVEVSVGDSNPPASLVATIAAVLNANPLATTTDGSGSTTATPAPPKYVVRISVRSAAKRPTNAS